MIKYVPDYVVFDVETTGLSPINDDIIELSALKVRKGEVVDTFSTLVNPARSIPYAASKVNGITDRMVADAPQINEVISEFISFIELDVLVGHNIHTFDMKFINKAAADVFGLMINNDYVDTLQMSRMCLPELRNHKLVDISAHFNISSEGAHRALNDCIMNQKCYEELGKLLSGIKVEQCPKCGSELKKRNGRFGEFWGCSNYPACRFTRN